jgi:putative membrane protein
MQDKQFDWYTPQKLSPYAFLFIIGKVINQSWAFLLIFIGGKFLKKEKGIAELGMGYFILIIIGFIVLASIPNVIQYLRFRIFIKGNDLIVLKGLFTKKVITIPIHKIQSVNAVQGYLNRFTETCELKIETAGDEGTEVEIKAIDEKKGYALQELLKKGPKADETITTHEPETILGIRFWDIIKLSLSENHVKTFLLILIYLLTKIDDVKNLFGIDTAKKINEEADKIAYTTNIILAFTLIVLFITFIVSFIRVLIRYYNMKLKISEKGFETQWGFLQTQKKLLIKENIQQISWKNNLFQRILGIKILRFFMTSENSNTPKQWIRIPIMQERLLTQISHIYQNVWPSQVAAPNGIDASYKWRNTLIFVTPLYLIAAITVYFKSPWLILVPLAVFIYFAIVHVILQYNYIFWFHQNSIQIYKGIWGREQTILNFKNVQQVEIKTIPFLRSHNLCTLVLHSAGEDVVKIPYIPAAQANYIANWCLVQIEFENIKT